MNADPTTTVHRFRVVRDQDDPTIWLAEWIEDDGVHTFARSLPELEDLARDALALWLRTDADHLQVKLDVEFRGACGRGRQ